MIPQAARSAIVLSGLVVLLILAGLWGWRAATEPFPSKVEAPRCLDTAVAAGEKVFPAQVIVSVYNSGERNGLAGRTRDLFTDAGFAKGDTGNAPDGTEVSFAEIWTETPLNPDVLLVASRLGPEAEIVRRKPRGIGVMVLVGDDFNKLVKGKRRVKVRDDAQLCVPPIE